MKFITISDTHGCHRELELPAGDAIIHSGDFCDLGNVNEVLDFVAWYKELDYEWKLLIGGNHDDLAATQPARFKAMLSEEICYLNDSGTTVNGLNIWGSPVQPDLVGWAFGKNRGMEMKAHWDLVPEDTDILITHTPPYGILDKSSRGLSLGCEMLLDRLKVVQPKFHIFGHIHASYGRESNGDTEFINASNYNSRRGLVNAPVVFEIT